MRARAAELQDAVFSLCLVASQAMRGEGGAIIVTLDDIVRDEVVLDNDAGTLQGGLQPDATRRSLADAREIIQEHRGSVTISTEVGVGTSFDVYLPVLAALEDSEGAPAKGVSRHVIYVDDYEPMRALVGETLADAGFRVSCFEGAREALVGALRELLERG